MRPLLVLHELGDERGGAPWREVLVQDGWEGPWSAPDQPGHGDAPWEADYYEPAHLVMAPLRHLLVTGWRDRPIVVGVGAYASAAELLALGGRAAGVVLVGRRPEPASVTADESIAADYEWLRRVADDTEAQAPAPQGRTDPRTRHGVAPHHDPHYAARQRAAIPVPVLEVSCGEPAEVLAAIRDWWAAQPDDL